MTYGLAYLVLGLLTAWIGAATTERQIRRGRRRPDEQFTGVECVFLVLLWPAIWFYTIRSIVKG